MQLPDIDALKRLLQSLAILDAILSPEWEDRYHSFNSQWAKGEQMGSFRDGSGDDYFVFFNASGCWLKGFAHEHPHRISPTVLSEHVPIEFASCVTEPAFSTDDTTFCYWRRYEDSEWQMLGSEECASEMFTLWDGEMESYWAWAEEHFEREDLPIDSIRAIYNHHPLVKSLVLSLNSKITLDDLAKDRAEIGYP
jgi:hypothetical protein